MPPLIILAGPTATGKSETAVELAEHLDAEIISADSLQVYRHFNIGTAKPAEALRRRVPHHLIDVVEPDEEFTAYEFKRRAESVLGRLQQEGRTAILAGGTGLYLQVLLENRGCGIQVDPELRRRLREEIRDRGPRALHEQLRAVDPVTAARVEPTDPVRIERALGVYRQTGVPLSRFHEQDAARAAPRGPALRVLLEMDRTLLYERLNRRVEAMLSAGWLEEVRGLLARGFGPELKPFRGIGYAQLARHLLQGLPLGTAVEEIKQETRHYAKRQMTWFRKQPGFQTVRVEPGDTPASLKDKLLSLCRKAAAVLACLFCLHTVPGEARADNLLEEAGRWIRQGKAEAACKRLETERARHPDSRTARRADYLLGRCHAALNHLPKAVEHFKAALRVFPELEDYIRVHLAQIYLRAHRPQAALEEATRVLQQFPQTRVAPEAEWARARALVLLDKPDQALFFLQEAEQRLSREPTDPDFEAQIPNLILEQARLHELQESASRAYLNYRKLYVRYPDHESADEAKQAMRRLVRAHGFGPIPLLDYEMTERTAALLRAGRYEEAVKTLLDYRAAFPKTRPPAQWYFDLATAQKNLRQRREAIDTLRRFLEDHPLDRRVQEARFRLGRLLWNLGRNQEGLEYFKLILKTTLKPSWKIRARFFIARVYENIGRPGRALPHYRALLEMGGDHPYLEKAAWRLAWMPLKDHQWETALTRLRENVRRWPQGRLAPRNLFWTAKALEALGRAGEALNTYARLLEEFPYTYYGVRAEQKLKALKRRVPGANHPKVVKTGFVPSEEPPPGLSRPLSPPERFHYERALTLSELGLYPSARREARRAAATVRKNLSGVLWASDLFLKARAFPEALRVLYLYRDYKQAGGEKDLPVAFWKNFFPRAFFPLIEPPAREFGVDPYFVNGLIRQESLFDAEVVSPAGARGLMQIMPETGRRLFTPDPRHPKYEPDALFDPGLNIRLGIKYLGRLAEKYGDNGVHLLISYNAGPQVLEKWRKRFQQIKDEDLFIESLPYPETRGYVKRVLRNVGIYRRLYGEGQHPGPSKTF